MIRKILLFMLLAWGWVVSTAVFAHLWRSDTGLMNLMLMWAAPVLLVLLFLYSVSTAVRHNLRTSNHYPGFNGLLPTRFVIGMIGKWGVRW